MMELLAQEFSALMEVSAPENTPWEQPAWESPLGSATLEEVGEPKRNQKESQWFRLAATE